MALFRITIKQTRSTNGIRLEKGMSVEVAHGNNAANGNTIFTTLEGKEKIAKAFMTKYGLDVKKACALSTIYMESELLGK